MDLIAVCTKSNDTDAWEEFVFRFQRPIRQSILRVVRERGEFSFEIVEDLAQDTLLKLCRDKCQPLLGFALQNPGQVEGYIRTIAINLARDYFKSLAAQRRGKGLVEQFPDRFEPGASKKSHGGQEATEQEVLVHEISTCLEKCLRPPDKQRDRIIFWLYYRDGWSAAAIAVLPTVELAAKGVESAIGRLTRLVREEIVKMRLDST